MADTVRYKGVFNWHGQVLTVYRHASTEAQAFNFMTRALAADVGVYACVVRSFFNRDHDNYKIERV